jgi:hypothetical protein
MVGIDTAPASLIGHISTTQPITVSRTVNVVCPVIMSVNASGCFSCDQGATVTVFARSTCSSGGAVVTGVGFLVATTSVVLTTDIQRFDIRISATVASLDGTITLTSGSYSDTKAFSATLVHEDLVVQQNTTVVVTGTNTSGSGFLDFQSWFDSLSSWMRGLLVFGMVVGAIILAIIAFVILSKMWTAYSSYRLQNRYEKLDNDRKLKAIQKAQMRNLDLSDLDQ